MSQELAPDPRRGLTARGVAVEEWNAAVDAKVTRVGMRILMGADVFFFAAFFFAFFYLRAMNNNYAWLPPATTHPTRFIGAMIVVLLAVCAILYILGARAAASAPATARLLFWLALLAGVLSIGVQVYEFRNLGFDPQQGGGFPSVFVGFKGVLMAQTVGALIWLATHIAQAEPAGDTVVRPASAILFGNFLLFLAGVSLVAYLVLYFV